MKARFTARNLIPMLSLASLLLLGACGDGDDEASCPSGQVSCDGTCVDTSTSAAHCGSCDNACAPGATCTAGVCDSPCPHGKAPCDGACVDLTSDADNCGQCGTSCTDGQVCSDGECTSECGAEETLCGDSCVLLDSNPDHCGDCNVACGDDQTCVSGNCESTCPDGQTLCDEECIDVTENDEHCGTCGNACDGGLTCIASECRCPEGHELCDGECVDVRSSDQHCGTCDRSCVDQPNASFGFCNAGVCQLDCEGDFLDCDPERPGCETDPLHTDTACGSCTNDCTTLAHTVGGTCDLGICDYACEDDWGDCDLDSTNGCETSLLMTREHCGACDNDCADLANVAETRCEEGGCVIVSCAEGWDDCDGDPSNGCEASLDIDVAHCGACDNVCKTFCIAGSCSGTSSLPVRASNHYCIIQDDGAVFCWGHNSSRQIGTNDSAPEITKPTRVQDTEEGEPLVAEEVGLGSAFTCARTPDGRVACWGTNFNGQLGSPGTTGNSAVPVFVHDEETGAHLRNVSQIAVGSSFACARLEDGRAKCWGDNFYAQLGANHARGDLDDDSAGEALTVVASSDTLDPLTGVQYLTAGSNFACALLAGGTVKCWGNNQFGTLGTGDLGGMEPAPVDVENLVDVQQLSPGSDATCALLPQGKVQCWGYGLYGQLGNEATQNQPSPVDVIGLDGPVSRLFAGGGHFCALFSEDRSAKCWGRNNYRQIGGGSTTNSQTTAIDVLAAEGGPKLQGIEAIVGGTLSTCALMQDGELLCWGSNNYGELGNGTTSSSAVPYPEPVVW